MADLEPTELGGSRSAVVPSESIRAFRRATIQIRFVPPPENFDAQQAFTELQSLGLDVEGLSAEGIEKLAKIGSEIIRRMAYENLSPEAFAKDPSILGDLLGDELVELVKKLADRAASLRSVLDPPDLEESTQRAKRRRSQFSYSARDPHFEEEKRLLLQKLIEWEAAESTNREEFTANPKAVIQRLGADQHPAVQQALIDFYKTE